MGGDGASNALDITKLIDVMNGVLERPAWSTDLDRSGETNVQDILRLVDVLNGAGALDPFNGVSLP